MNDIVYHYTSPEGILGILRENMLWFTDCQYLSDRNEFRYIKEPFESALAPIMEKRPDLREELNGVSSFLEDPYEFMSIKSIEHHPDTTGTIMSFAHHRYYVLCTSINSDSASMWNHYVKNSVYKGYNLGIDTKFIRAFFQDYCTKRKEIDFIAGQIIYDKTKQVEEIDYKLRKLIEQYDESEGEAVYDLSQHRANVLHGGIFDFISDLKLFFKSPAYASEEEYRFVLKVEKTYKDDADDRDFPLKFRVGESGVLTPYVEWKYPKEEIEKLFRQVTLAPMIETELAKESFRRMLNTKVKQSSIKIVESSMESRF